MSEEHPWDNGEATVQQLCDVLEESKLAYATTLTAMQVFTKKNIETFEKRGKANVYKPLLMRHEYINEFMADAKENVFGGSIRSFFFFLCQE